jgi:hypothetical protein
LLRSLARVSMPVLLTPGVIHLPTVPAHRKVNRVDMGTSDKVCAVTLAIRERADRRRCAIEDVSFILLELGGAFTAAVAVDGGRIVDGAGGSSGPIGMRASGALDGEVAFLAGTVGKSLVFSGGADAIAGAPGISAEALADSRSLPARTAWEAYMESAAKAVAALAVAVPQAPDVVLPGRGARSARVRDELAHRLLGVVDGVAVHVLDGAAPAIRPFANRERDRADFVGGAHVDAVDLAVRGHRREMDDTRREQHRHRHLRQRTQQGAQPTDAPRFAIRGEKRELQIVVRQIARGRERESVPGGPDDQIDRSGLFEQIRNMRRRRQRFGCRDREIEKDATIVQSAQIDADRARVDADHPRHDTTSYRPCAISAMVSASRI